MKIDKELLQGLMNEALEVAAAQDVARLKARKARLDKPPEPKEETPKAEG